MLPSTQLALAGIEPLPAQLSEAVLVLCDFQNEYLSGPFASTEAAPAIRHASQLLAAARHLQSRILHIVHRGKPGGPFDRSQPGGDFIPAMRPWPWETVIEKVRPNAFAGSDLGRRLGQPGTRIILAGFQTHCCISSTARAAQDLGYPVTIAADACAARDLPGPDGMVPAAQVHRVEIAVLADRYAAVVKTADLLSHAQIHHHS